MSVLIAECGCPTVGYGTVLHYEDCEMHDSERCLVCSYPDDEAGMESRLREIEKALPGFDSWRTGRGWW